MAELKAGPRQRKPLHPGGIVARELAELGVSVNAAAQAIGVTRMMLGNLVNEKAALSPEMALRLGRYFGNGPEIWLKLQAEVDLWDARENLGKDLAKIKLAPRSD